MVVKDTSHWVDRNGTLGGKPIYYVEQVKSALGIDKELRLPPTAKENTGNIEGVCVPVNIFPSWVKCTKCHFLSYKPWYQNSEQFPLVCARNNCTGKLEQLPWVLVHAQGFLNDVPYHGLTHKNNNISCKQDWNSVYLQARPSGKKYRLSCTRCNASNDFFPGGEMPWWGSEQPWSRGKPSAEVLNESPTGSVLAVSDPRVHFTERKNALVVPPESRIKRGSVVDRLYSSAEKRICLNKSKNRLAQKSAIKLLANDLKCDVSDIHEAVLEIEKGYPLYGQNITVGNLLKSEYQALLELIPNLSEDEDFVTRHYSKDWHALRKILESNSYARKAASLIDAVVGVERLKEIMIMTGFGRLSMDPDNQHILPPDLVGESDWLPALELYGEGIFITLDQSILADWETQPALIRRIQELEERLGKWGSDLWNKI